MIACHLLLRALAAVNHEQFASQADKLRRRVVTRAGFCRPTAKYLNIEWFHFYLVPQLYGISLPVEPSYELQK